jgi:ribonuclease HII
VLDLETEVTGWPADLQDSKLMSEPKRETIAPQVGEWVNAWAVGEASVAQIEALGIVRALGIAAAQALGQLKVIGLNRRNTVLLLDGKHNWLAPVANGVPVVTEIKADQTAVSVASASVLAKVYRDGLMRQAHETYDAYGFAGNKGYSAPDHIAALRTLGPSPIHRVSWLEKILASEDA